MPPCLPDACRQLPARKPSCTCLLFAGLSHLLSSLHIAPLPQAKADAQVRWAVLNVVTLLRRHEATHDALADAMARGASVVECIELIEQRLAGSTDI